MAKFNTIEHLQDGRHAMAECSFWNFIRRIQKPQYEGWIDFSWGCIRIEKPDPYNKYDWLSDCEIYDDSNLPF